MQTSTSGLHSQTETLRRIHRIQLFTILWMTVEVVISFTAARIACSPSLVAFGGDSTIELLSATVVLWRFRSRSANAQTEKQAARAAAVLLFLLAAFVTIASVAAFLGHTEARPSPLGIALLLAAAVVMPRLARQKSGLSAATSSGALRADAVQSAMCGYMAWIALAGLVLNAVWGVKLADPIAALILTPLILWEGWKSWEGEPCPCG
jgi:divalent metal cation (Fe/Co/Zn/Cd) transporter